jgi:hypothetical protein
MMSFRPALSAGAPGPKALLVGGQYLAKTLRLARNLTKIYVP